MQKWEYLSITARRRQDKGWHTQLVNGNELPNWEKGLSLHDYLNNLGEQGWELVSVWFVPPEALHLASSWGLYEHVFKRPKL